MAVGTFASAAKDRPSCFFMASATPAICGCLSPMRSLKDHAVIVPDLRGTGPSSHPEGGYEKVAQRPKCNRAAIQIQASLMSHVGFCRGVCHV
jgi:hypothetical protein